MKNLPWILLAILAAVAAFFFLRPQTVVVSGTNATGATGKPAGDTAGGVLSGIGDVLGGLGTLIGSFASGSSSSSSGSTGSSSGSSYSTSGGDPNAGSFGNPNAGGEA